ncbi:MAG: hypothetical protein COB04_06525 [Gammaproteobacteria bacterium]|nr:MAG: hypothetical protein COB04_06525 [Gammaproteobacteria bacterium]
MSNEQLPKKIDPLKLINHEVSLTGTINLEDMTRLNACIEGGDPLVQADLSFYRDGQRFRVIEGSCSAKVSLVCQRCLEPTDVSLDAEFALAVVTDDEWAKKLPKRYDALILEESPILLAEVVEDELLLCLPSVPKHTHECDIANLDFENPKLETEAKPNPFEVLAELKKK